MTLLIEEVNDNLKNAVAHFWKTRLRQLKRQQASDRKDQGARSAVTGGAQMDGFISLIANLVAAAGVTDAEIFRDKLLELPGYFRPTKEWDLLVVSGGRLLVAVETKSQVGPSFGNNFNNRTEEAMGSALDLWTAYREGAFNGNLRPWLGYFFLLEDCPASNRPVNVREPHFPVFPEFRGASYAKRYEIFCRKLVRERHYDAAALIMSSSEKGRQGIYTEPVSDLNFELFARSLVAHVGAYAK
ncbi:MAG: Type-2 restriction enzyme PaeR7I [Pelotomaculum sp. PtaU1.Bin035]|nr:MAG: Type-2 restriction enzyme PaeR7I [Pelotomaculum sp. PtaU1.Bin035]